MGQRGKISDKEAEEIFVAALREALSVGEVGRRVRLPCNLSTVNDRIMKMERGFRIGDTNYPRFGDLARDMEKK